MPVIFSSSLMIFPSDLQGPADSASNGMASWWQNTTDWLAQTSAGEFPYVMCELVLIYFSATSGSRSSQPDEWPAAPAITGHSIPDLRPGPRTAEYLETV